MSRTIVTLLVLVFGSVVVACESPSPTEAPESTVTSTPEPTANVTETPPSATPMTAPEQPATIYGVSLSPLTYGHSDFLEFLDLTEASGASLRSGNQWFGLAEPDQPANVVAQLADQRGLVAVIETNFFVQESGEITADVTDPSVRQEMVRVVRDFAEMHQPEYFGLAVEVNIIEETNPGAFDAFADEVFPAAAAAIREVSPETKVFLTFQLERLRGLRGGLFGGENDPSEADWDLLSRFPGADLISFTTYPTLVYRDPSEIPDGYYDEILEHTDKPVAFTEIGWLGDSSIPGWEADGAEQARFVDRFLEMVDPLEPELLIWAFMFDQAEAPEPFITMGLRSLTGEPRPAWESWLDGRE